MSFDPARLARPYERSSVVCSTIKIRRVFLSSRPHAVQDSQLPSSEADPFSRHFDVLRIQELTPDDASAYAQRLHNHLNADSKRPVPAADVVNQLFSLNLPRTPLFILLGTIVLGSTTSTVHNEFELYDELVRRQVSIKDYPVSPTTLARLLSCIGFACHHEALRGLEMFADKKLFIDTFDKVLDGMSQFLEQLRRMVKEMHEALAEPETKSPPVPVAVSLLQDLAQLSGLFYVVEEGKRQLVVWQHQSIQEFLAAKFLVEPDFSTLFPPNSMFNFKLHPDLLVVQSGWWVPVFSFAGICRGPLWIADCLLRAGETVRQLSSYGPSPRILLLAFQQCEEKLLASDAQALVCDLLNGMNSSRAFSTICEPDESDSSFKIGPRLHQRLWREWALSGALRKLVIQTLTSEPPRRRSIITSWELLSCF